MRAELRSLLDISDNPQVEKHKLSLKWKHRHLKNNAKYLYEKITTTQLTNPTAKMHQDRPPHLIHWDPCALSSSNPFAPISSTSRHQNNPQPFSHNKRPAPDSEESSSESEQEEKDVNKKTGSNQLSADMQDPTLTGPPPPPQNHGFTL